MDRSQIYVSIKPDCVSCMCVCLVCVSCVCMSYTEVDMQDSLKGMSVCWADE